jgi:hypothetical protein
VAIVQARAALATALWQSHWRMMLRGHESAVGQLPSAPMELAVVLITCIAKG